MIAEVIISPKARRDLKNIGIHTENKWGQRQRRKYLAQLEDSMQTLAERPSLGKQRCNLPETHHIVSMKEDI